MGKITIYPVKDESKSKLLYHTYGFLIEEEGKPDKVIQSHWDYWEDSVERLCVYLKRAGLKSEDFIDISKK